MSMIRGGGTILRLIAACVLVGAALTGLCWSTWNHNVVAADGASTIPAPVGPAVGAAELAKWHLVGGERFTDMSPPVSVISVAQAEAIALNNAVLGGAAPIFAVRYGQFSNDHQFRILSDGSRQYTLQNRQVWLVRFANVTKPLFGKPGIIVGDYNVVIDAGTGAYIGAFMVE